MSSVVISGDTSGTVAVTVPAVAGTNTITLPAGTGTAAIQGVSTNIVSGTAVASTSGTSIDFTSIPSWVKRVTVMYSGVSTNGTSFVQIQVGAGSVTTSGYLGSYSINGTTQVAFTTGIGIGFNGAADLRYGQIVFTLITGNTWVASGTIGLSNVGAMGACAGSIALGGTLDRVRVTTVNGTDTFDAGTINILYE